MIKVILWLLGVGWLVLIGLSVMLFIAFNKINDLREFIKQTCYAHIKGYYPVAVNKCIDNLQEDFYNLLRLIMLRIEEN